MIMQLGRALIVLAAASCVGGCVVRTAASVVTAPVRVAAKGVDWATTSQSEADEKRGRDLRHGDERRGDLERRYRHHSQQCGRGDEHACREAQEDYDRLQQGAAADGR
jgi:hypothetical protein